MSARSILAVLACCAPVTFAAFGGCAPEAAPLKVQGPTTARPDGTPSATDAKAEANMVATGRVVKRNADSRVVSFRIAFAAGSSDDPQGKEGLTELTAALMTEGGTKSLTYAQLVEKLYPMAAEIHVNVDRDETVFEARVASASLDTFYPLLREVLSAPRFDAESFARLRARATSDLVSDLRGADDESLGKEALHALIYEGHPYAHPTVGTEHGLAAITLDDVGAHRKHVFCKDRVMLGLAGGFPEGFDATVAKDLGELPGCDAPRAALPAPKAKKGIQVLIVDKPTADATAISIGFPTTVTRVSADYPSLVFAADYLGLHRQSAGILFQELREKRGLNYGDYAYAEFFEQAGPGRYPKPNLVRRQQLVSIWLRPMKPVNAHFALRGALRSYARFRERGASDVEIARFRKFLAGYLELEQQTESRRLGYAMDDASVGLKGSRLDLLRRAWGELDEKRLRAFLAQLPPTDLQIAIVTRDGAALAAALEKGDPSPPTYDAPKPDEVKTEDREIEKLVIPLRHEDIRIVPVAQIFN